MWPALHAALLPLAQQHDLLIMPACLASPTIACTTGCRRVCPARCVCCRRCRLRFPGCACILSCNASSFAAAAPGLLAMKW
jgi:hypothetical protein